MSNTDFAQYSLAQQQTFVDFNINDDQFAFDTADFAPAKGLDILDFESEIDATLDPSATFNIPDNTDLFQLLRSDTPTRGIPSVITVSSVSDSFDSYLESHSSYNPIASPGSQYSSVSFVQELNIVDHDMARLGVIPTDASSVYSASHSENSSPGSISLPSFSPELRGRSYSDYEPPLHDHIRSTSSEYLPSHPSLSQYTHSMMHHTVVPANMSAQLPHSGQSPSPMSSGEQSDPKKKYACTICSRAFARQFNLKTHMHTHNPDHPKPYACTHKGCGRAFSRKHDLMRHTTSIHHAPAQRKQIGVGSSARARCDQCGKSAAGNESGCGCEDEK